ncbi:HNH endonuclease [Burkholderia pseudomallei]|uniref:HNH endonuclease n=1 Tax=Burkholderia pseudomallei TaxID=28450 RepID=UPI0027429916|nr:HNH endonuclease [Burkholderia pseudomallei]
MTTSCRNFPLPSGTVLWARITFLEVHHLRKLADGGSDMVTNAVAVCPNCHRRLHFSKDACAYRETLYGKVTELVRE